jgi:hypothetical protein
VCCGGALDSCVAGGFDAVGGLLSVWASPAGFDSCVAAGFDSVRGLATGFVSVRAVLLSVRGSAAGFGSCVAAGFDSVRGLAAGFVSVRAVLSVRGSAADFDSCVVAGFDSVRGLAAGFVLPVFVCVAREVSDVREDAALLAVARSEAGAFAATTPVPLNSPGFAVAATAGRPWLTEANWLRSERAALSCSTCAAAGGMWRSCAKVSSWAVGRAFTPPVPPLKLTRVTFCTTVFW